MIFFLLAILSCSEVNNEFDRANFENIWWEFPEYPLCFNFHESGDVLLFEERISSEGLWIYHDPSQYEFLNGEELITVIQEEECWLIEDYSQLSSFVACECTLR
jgi:hypothetical protein